MKNLKPNGYPYFSHESPRDGQRDIMDLLYDLFRDEMKRGAIIAADPGIGKEACMTSQALQALDDGIFDVVIFVIPTDSGKINIQKELDAVEHTRKVIKINSKEALCLWMKQKDDEQINTIEGEKCAFLLCKVMGHKCEFRDNGCLYDLQKKEIMDAEILICDYNYIFSPFICKRSGIENIMNNKKVLLLVNECHRLPGRVESILSNSLSSNTVDRAIAELNKFGFETEKQEVIKFRDMLAGNVEKNRNKMEKQINDYNTEYGNITIEPALIDSMCGEGNSLISAGEKISQLKWDNKEGIVSYAGIVGNFLQKFHGKEKYSENTIYFLKLRRGEKYLFTWDDVPDNDNGRLADFLKRGFGVDWISRKSVKIEKTKKGSIIKVSTPDNFLSLEMNDKKTEVILKTNDDRKGKLIAKAEDGTMKIYDGTETHYIGWSPTFVGGFISKALMQTNKFVLYSGTCSPGKFRHTVGLTRVDILTPPRFESPFLKNRKDIILTKATFNAKKRAKNKKKKASDDNFLTETSKDIEMLLSSMPKPAAIVCTNSWFRTLTFPPVILNEPESQDEVNDWLTNQAKNADLIRFSPYGRVAQSVDMSFLRSILFIGFPYSSYDNIAQEKIKRLAKSYKGKSGNAKYAASYRTIIVPACEAVVQSVMRGLRTEKDRLAVIYFDKQFQMQKESINSKTLSICKTVEEAITELDQFKNT